MSKQTKQAEQIEATPTHECAVCGNPFIGTTAKAKYCSDECKAEGKREANRRFYAVHGSGKADPKNQMRVQIEQYLWAKTGEALAKGWKGEASDTFARRTAALFEKLGSMNADAKRLLTDAEKIVVMLNVRALCNGKHKDLTSIDASEQSLREALAVAIDGLAASMTQAA